MNEVLRIIAARSSARSYTEEKLTDKEIELLVTAGLQAPTGRNMQEVHISVLKGSHPVLAEINADLKRSSGGIQDNRINFYYNAPTVFMLSTDKEYRWNFLDAGICAENIVLAAESLGLGSLIIGIIRDVMWGEKEEYYAKELKFPANTKFAICVAVGHKNLQKKPHEINFEKNVVFVEEDEQVISGAQ